MNIWTFLDRNGGGMIFAFFVLLFALALAVDAGCVRFKVGSLELNKPPQSEQR